MTTSFYLRQNLRSSEKTSAPSWGGVPLLLSLDPRTLADASVSDLLYLVDFVYRLCIEVQDDTRPPQQTKTAWEERFSNLGYGQDASRRISLAERCAAAASRCSLFVDWVFESAARTHAEPDLGGAEYDPGEFVAPQLLAYVNSGTVSATDKYDLLVQLVRLVRVHAELLMAELIPALLPDGVSGTDAAFLSRTTGNALALVADRKPYLLITLSPLAREGIKRLGSVVRRQYLDDEKRQLYRRFGAEAFGKPIVLIDPETALATAFLDLVSGFLERVDGSSGQAWQVASSDYRNLFTLSRHPPQAMNEATLPDVADFAFMDALRNWPHSIPESEMLARQLALVFVLQSRDIRTAATGEAGSWNFFADSTRVVGLRMPGDGALPKATALQRNLIATTAGAHPLLNWLVLPSVLKGSGLPVMYADSHYADADVALSALLASGERAQRLETVKKELRVGLISAGGFVVSTELLMAVLPSLPASAYGAAGTLVSYLVQRWAEGRRRLREVQRTGMEGPSGP